MKSIALRRMNRKADLIETPVEFTTYFPVLMLSHLNRLNIGVGCENCCHYAFNDMQWN